MEDSWLINVLHLVSNDLKTGHSETIENLSDEMREDYLLSVKKAIGKIRDQFHKAVSQKILLMPFKNYI